MATQSEPMSQDTKIIIVILLLIFFYPLGLIFMWLWMKEWPTWAKLLISLPVALGILAMLLLMFAVVFGISTGHFMERSSNWKNYRYLQPYMIVSPSPIPSSVSVSSLSKAEEKQLYTAAREFIKKNSDPKLQFDLDLVKVVGNKYALLKVIPLNMEIDSSQVIMQKVNGVWVAQTFGTSFPEWYQKVPELFS